MEWGHFLQQPRRGWRATRARAACALLAAALCAPLPVAARTASAPAQTQILPPFQVGPGADLDFGQVTRSGAAGTVVIPPSGANTSGSCATTGGLIHAGNCRAARFDGDVSWLFVLRVTKPAGNQLILTGPGGATMLVNNLTYGGTTGLFSLGATATEQTYLVTSGSGQFTLHVGATLNVAANQALGVYNGTFVLTFNYN